MKDLTTNARRRLLTALPLVTGAIWNKPMARTIVLPVHARGTTILDFTAARGRPAPSTMAFVRHINYNGENHRSLPQASGGVAPYRYTLSPDLPPGLTYNAAENHIYGAPNRTYGPAQYTLTAEDAVGNTGQMHFTLTVLTAAP